MNYGYIYISTHKDKEAGEKWREEKLKELTSAGAAELYVDIFNPAKKGQPKLDELFNRIQENDVLTILSLERFARKTGQCVDLLTRLQLSGAKLIILHPSPMTIDASHKGNAIRRELIKLLENEKATYYNTMFEKKKKKNAWGGRPRKADKRKLHGDLTNKEELNNEKKVK